MTNILLSCWEYSRNHEHVLPVTVFWQFGRLVDSKVGFNPPFHSIRGPLDRSGPCGVKQATFYNTQGARPNYFSDVVCWPIKNRGGGDWLDGSQTDECKFSGRHPSNQSQIVVLWSRSS